MTNTNKFLKMAAAWNCGISDVSKYDGDVEIDSPFSENDCVKTHEAVENFTNSAPVMESEGVKFYVRTDFQIRKGLRKGDLFVADFGDHLLTAFTGQAA